MIISHKYKFIFLKTNKTAGTSIEIALSEFCDKDDIITPISTTDEIVRSNLGYQGSQNYHAPLLAYNLKDWTNLLIKQEKKNRFYNHISAKMARKYLRKKMWNDYFKFCFERNPWDRVISLYYWQHKTEPRPGISEFLNSKVPLELRKKGLELYTINGKVVVDKIYRYENLEEELKAITVQLNLPKVPVLPKTKSTHRLDKRHYRDILNDEDRKKIEKMFSEEIRLLGYEF
jgi:hypothetical protein